MSSAVSVAVASTNLDEMVSYARQLCDEQKFPEAANLLKANFIHGKHHNVGRIDAALEALVSGKYTVIMVGLIAMKFKCQQLPDWKQIAGQVQTLVTILDSEQVALVREMFNGVIHEFCKMLVARRVPAMGIPIVQVAIRHSQPNLKLISAIHADLFLLCLKAKIFKPAMPFLAEAPVDLVVNEQGTFDSLPFLLYCFYGGKICCVLKDFKLAAFFFEAAVACPCSAVSAVMTAAYNWLVLVSLLVNGKPPTLPKYTSIAALRSFRYSTSTVYNDLGQHYVENKVDEFIRLVQQQKSFLESQEMYGLVKQVQESLVCRSIQRLTKAFRTVSLADIARRVSPPLFCTVLQ